jgi:hypothetical protein
MFSPKLMVAVPIVPKTLLSCDACELAFVLYLRPLCHRVAFSRVRHLDVAGARDINVTVARDFLNVLIVDAERVETRSQTTSEAVPTAPVNLSILENRPHNPIREVMKIERPAHLRADKYKPFGRKAVATAPVWWSPNIANLQRCEPGETKRMWNTCIQNEGHKENLGLFKIEEERWGL